jgi:hypothetical protein
MPAMVTGGAARRGKAPDAEETVQAPEQTAAAPGVARRGVAGATDPEAQASILLRATGGRLARAGGILLRLQQAFGNRHVQQVVHHALGTPRSASVARPGLVLSQPHDHDEREADQVARQVVGPAARRPAGGHGGTRAHAVDPLVERAIREAPPGRPLPGDVREPLEGLLGADLPEVRVHTDTRADQLARVLRARAFTTGRDIFFRRGEYHPGSQAGQALLAHELTHTVQQAAAPAAAGVIQRVEIDGDSTETEDGLRNLRLRVIGMKRPEEVQAWLELLPPIRALATPGEQLLHDYLQTQAASLKPRRRVVRSEAPRNPVSGGIVPEAPSKSEDVPISSSEPLAAAVNVPTKVPVVSPERPAQPRVEGAGKQPSEELARKQRIEEFKKAKGLTAQAPGEGQRKPPRRQVDLPVAGSRSSGSERPVDEAGILSEGGRLTDRAVRLGESATKLAEGPGDGPGAVDAWLEASDLWLKTVEEAFLPEVWAWTDSFGKLAEETRQRTTTTLAEPLSGQVAVLSDQADALRTLRVELPKRYEQQRAAAHRDKAIAERDKAIAERRRELAGLMPTVDEYVVVESIRLEGAVYKGVDPLPIQWLFAAAISQAKDRSKSNPSVAGLLEYLRTRKHDNKGLMVTVVGTEYAKIPGRGGDDYVVLHIELRTMDPLHLLGDDAAEGTRKKLIAETASTFIHEASHSLQRSIYRNQSYPWRREQSPLTSPTSGVVDINALPTDVRRAVEEFTEGGREGLAANDTAWIRLNQFLQGEDYYIRRKKDLRASEVVSYLMELRYAWNDEDRFEDLFPFGAELLQRVITYRW